MIIHEIIHKPDRQTKTATIHLNYDEIRDIANMLCSITKQPDYQTEGYKTLHRDFFWLFEIVKNGLVDGFTCEHLYKLNQKIHDDKLVKNTRP